MTETGPAIAGVLAEVKQAKPMPIDPRPIVHIGHHKTGTTWFQKKFYPRVSGYRFIPRELVRMTLLAESPLAFAA